VTAALRKGGLLVAACLVSSGCGSMPIHITSLDEVERIRVTPAAREGAERAPEVSARAEQERTFAIAAHAAGDNVAATLHAERAIAAYGHALGVARLAVATAELADSQKALDDATAQAQSLEVSRAGVERDSTELTQHLELVRDRVLPAPSAAAAADREVARLSAARSLAAEARLLCGAARLVATDAAGLTDAEADLATLDTKLDLPQRAKERAKDHVQPIDDAGAARARCLDVLTRARRGTGDDDGQNDALLAELSASGGWAPARDERGVIVTLRGAFHGSELSHDGQAKLKVLGQVAAAHPGFAVQVVLHDAQAPSAGDRADTRRADAAIKALVAAGAPSARVKAELAGARAPVVDPGDAFRARNERVEVVYVGGRSAAVPGSP
jgi:outer membrane protein OmpA-like peptidoglycan-associated protein